MFLHYNPSLKVVSKTHRGGENTKRVEMEKEAYVQKNKHAEGEKNNKHGFWAHLPGCV